MTKELQKKEARSVTILATEGLSDSRKCANVLGAIALDVGLQRITPQTGNTMCNAIGKLLKLKELEIKHGTAETDGGLCPGTPLTRRLSGQPPILPKKPAQSPTRESHG